MTDHVGRVRATLQRLSALVAVVAILVLPLSSAAATPDLLQEPPPGAQPSSTLKMYLPLIRRSAITGWRIGYNTIGSDVMRYPRIGELDAGWVLNWFVATDFPRPAGTEFVQVVRVHQTLTCPLFTVNAWDRNACPYAVPYDYVVIQGLPALESHVRANPNALWLIGNEMDRRDWKVYSDPPSTAGQDEMLPEVYAVAYHDLYYQIKGIDPSAKVAIGGVIQATPQRLEYLTRIWNAYQSRYGSTMPVDVWNVHNFILPEHADGRGAGTPPGISGDGIIYPTAWAHVDMALFDQQIRAMRTWMKDRGEQNKPLIVSEYGVLAYQFGLEDPNVVETFMLQTFDYFLNTKDCSIGYAADSCRLVQRWAWYSLDDDGVWSGSGFNLYGPLFDYGTRAMTGRGERFKQWVADHKSQLANYAGP